MLHFMASEPTAPEPQPEPFVTLGPDTRDDQHRDVLRALYGTARNSPVLRFWLGTEIFVHTGEDVYLNLQF